MTLFDHPDFDDHEQVVFARDAASGLTAIIAVHDTKLGPSLGGCRIWRYESEASAVADVLRLSRGMTYKAALAGLALGGGKSVVLADSRTEKTADMMRAMGVAVERLGGRYIIAEDVGSTVEDMDLMAERTAHVSGLSHTVGDPSPWTAEGVFLAMRSAAQRLWDDGLTGRTVSVQGLGNVGARLCDFLHGAGARLVVSDIRAESVRMVAEKTDAAVVAPEAAHAADADIFAPCALGAGLNESTIPEISARMVCGAANNQLATEEDADRLVARDVLYAPDYLVNAGGLISVARPKLGLGDEAARAKLEAIPETLSQVLKNAVQQGVSPALAADRLARARIAA